MGTRFTEQWLAARKAREAKMDAGESAEGGGTARRSAPTAPASMSSEPAAPVIMVLPWPPSGNHGTKHPQGVHYITQAHEAYRETVARVVSACNLKPMRSPYSALVYWYPPDRRERDSDNVQKVLFDALRKCGIIENDSMLDRPAYTEFVTYLDEGAALRGKCVVILSPMSGGNQ